MADYYQYHTSGWVYSPSSISLCGSRHRLHIETESKIPTAGTKIMVRLDAEDTSGFINTKFKKDTDRPHKATLQITDPQGNMFINQSINGNQDNYIPLSMGDGEYEIVLKGPDESGTCKKPKNYRLIKDMDVDKPKSGSSSSLSDGIRLIDYRKTALMLVGVIVAGVLLMGEE